MLWRYLYTEGNTITIDELTYDCTLTHCDNDYSCPDSKRLISDANSQTTLTQYIPSSVSSMTPPITNPLLKQRQRLESALMRYFQSQDVYACTVNINMSLSMNKLLEMRWASQFVLETQEWKRHLVARLQDEVCWRRRSQHLTNRRCGQRKRKLSTKAPVDKLRKETNPTPHPPPKTKSQQKK